ncbi:hypothetical protein F511_38735 [Dorcoceras hygrometricum]|uniref:Acyl-CoA dehydrogenase-related protein n=1 Tax=Dorcoceras hygrometricum TaxID=472368 RepID=A0A2Z7C5T7_9LAMI|nr:hypothetical protein F511_38735 [Dorcoceras hygrometricum]
MSLFDLQDVRIAIGSLATLDLPMVVDLIGIYGLKGPYCTLTTTDWFLQALSVIPRGSWGDVARRFTMIRWESPEFTKYRRLLPFSTCAAAAAAAADLRRKFVSGRFDEENPVVQNLSVLLVQPDKGVSVLVMDRIGDYLPQSTEKSRVLVIPVGARHKCQQGIRFERPISNQLLGRNRRGAVAHGCAPPCARTRAMHARRPRMAGDTLHASSHAGRTTRAWWPNKRAHTDGRIVGRSQRKSLRRWSSITGDARRRFTRGRPAAAASMIARWSTLPAAGREVLREVAARCCAQCALAARRCARRRALSPRSSWWWRRRRPPLRRVSGDVVTAGMNSSRVWFGPVPGSP